MSVCDGCYNEIKDGSKLYIGQEIFAQKDSNYYIFQVIKVITCIPDKETRDKLELGLLNKNDYTKVRLMSRPSGTYYEASMNDLLNCSFEKFTKINFNIKSEENKMFIKVNTVTNTIPKIVDYKILNDRVVIVYYEDDTSEKAICDTSDTFDLERAIEVVTCKKMFGGTKAYNNAIRDALRQVRDVDERTKLIAKEVELEERRKAKTLERKAKKRAKRRQDQIDIQTEAFFNAMMKYDEKMESELMPAYNVNLNNEDDCNCEDTCDSCKCCDSAEE